VDKGGGDGQRTEGKKSGKVGQNWRETLHLKVVDDVHVSQAEEHGDGAKRRRRNGGGSRLSALNMFRRNE